MTEHGLSDLRAAFARAFAIVLPVLAVAAVGAALMSGRNLLPTAVLGIVFTGAGLATLFALGPTTLTRQVTSAALMGLVALLVLATAGTAWQIDMHMAFFAALAVVAGWCCWQSIVVGAGVVAVHHLVLNFVYPYAVFPDGADFSRVVLHAVILIWQAGVLMWLTNRLASSLEAATEATRAAVAAHDEAERAGERERHAAGEREQRRIGVDRAIAGFESRIARVIEDLDRRAVELDGTAGRLVSRSGAAEEQSRRADGLSREAASNVETVAAAAEELSASISEIARQIDQTTEVVAAANREAEAADREVGSLSTAVDKIGDVVKLIQDIAEQTNLLALNATIEAARAGELGKGFAVVAAEVKGLATQTGKATEEIAGQIAAVQASTSTAVDAIGKIAGRMREIDQFTGAVGRAIDQQTDATRDIATNVDLAASGVRRVVDTLVSVAQASTDTVTASGSVSVGSSALGAATGSIRTEIDNFLREVRAA